MTFWSRPALLRESPSRPCQRKGRPRLRVLQVRVLSQAVLNVLRLLHRVQVVEVTRFLLRVPPFLLLKSASFTESLTVDQLHSTNWTHNWALYYYCPHYLDLQLQLDYECLVREHWISLAVGLKLLASLCSLHCQLRYPNAPENKSLLLCWYRSPGNQFP